MVPLLGAIAGCHCSVLSWGKGRVTANLAGVDVVPLLGAIGAIVVCYAWGAGCWVHCRLHYGVLWWMVPLQGAGEGDDQVWGSGRGAIAGCHCMV